jgi:hypothetical protein
MLLLLLLMMKKIASTRQTRQELVDLLVREPLASLEVLLLERRIQYAQTPYLARRRRIVALHVGLGLAVRRLERQRAGSLFISRVSFFVMHTDRTDTATTATTATTTTTQFRIKTPAIQEKKRKEEKGNKNTEQLRRERKVTYLLLVVQTLVVVLEDGDALCLARVVFGVGVGHVAREDFLPEGEAARGA